MPDLASLLATPIATIGGTTVTVGIVAIVCATVLTLALLWLVIALLRSARSREAAALDAAERARDADMAMAGLARSQSEMQGRIAAMSDLIGTRQAELNHSLGQRLDVLTGRIGQTMAEQTRSTHENLAKLQERLVAIDAAQGNIQSLAGQVVQLQAILSNKQTRGAFGQARMEAIVADGLPSSAYAFQHTLSNGSRPDCTIRMPNDAPRLVIDAKFPLEAWHAIRAATDGERGLEAQKAAQQAFRRDLEVHVRAISEKYLIPGETNEMALMFVPSESIFAEIHENFEGVVQRAHKARVVIVSPSLLMLSIQVLQSIMKDAAMREQAHLIQNEVIRLLEDLTRLDDRVRKLKGHFDLTQKDIDQIVTSTEKVTKRGEKIQAMEFGESKVVADRDIGDAGSSRTSAASKTGSLRLRLVEEGDV